MPSRLQEPEPTRRTPEPDTRRLFLTVLPSIMLPMFLALIDQTIVATAFRQSPASSAASSACRGSSSPTCRRDDRRSVYGRLATALGRRRHHVRRDRHLRRGLLSAPSPPASRLPMGHPPGPRRRRADDALAGAGRRNDAAARPRPLPGDLAAIGVTSNTFGPVAGGFLTEHFGWRSIFLVKRTARRARIPSCLPAP